MNFHALERTTTLAAVAFVATGTAVATVADEPQKLSAAEMFAILAGFVVMLGGALTLAFVRWLNKVEKNVPRNPNRQDEKLNRLILKLDSLDAKMDGIDVRLARVEGNLGQFIVVGETK